MIVDQFCASSHSKSLYTDSDELVHRTKELNKFTFISSVFFHITFSNNEVGKYVVLLVKFLAYYIYRVNLHATSRQCLFYIQTCNILNM